MRTDWDIYGHSKQIHKCSITYRHTLECATGWLLILVDSWMVLEHIQRRGGP